MVHPDWPASKEVTGKLFDDFSAFINKKLNKDVDKIIHIKFDKKVYKVILKNGDIIRLDYKQKFYKQIGMLQNIVYNSGIKVPKVLSLDRIKLSEWIEGQDLYYVQNISTPNIQMGRLLGQLNSLEYDGKYGSQGDINNTNFIWTKDKELYMIDLGSLKFLDFDDAINRTAVGVSKRVSKERRKWFYEGYAEYYDIDKFIVMVSKYDDLLKHKGYNKKELK